MSGSYSDLNYSDLNTVGTGTLLSYGHGFGAIDAISVDYEEIWRKMYVQPKPVIIVCAACKSHNAVTNPVCVQCGYPMGFGEQRVF